MVPRLRTRGSAISRAHQVFKVLYLIKKGVFSSVFVILLHVTSDEPIIKCNFTSVVKNTLKYNYSTLNSVERLYRDANFTGD